MGDNGGVDLVKRAEKATELEQVFRRLKRKHDTIDDVEKSDLNSGEEKKEEEPEGSSSTRVNRKEHAAKNNKQFQDQREKDLSYVLDLSLTLYYALKSRMDSLNSASNDINQYSASPPRPLPPNKLKDLLPLLESLVRNTLTDQDFPDIAGVSEFPSNNGGEVKMVRNRFLDYKALELSGGPIEGNGKGMVCVMKTVVKAAARNHRKNGRMRVDLETQVLLASSKGFKAREEEDDSKIQDSGIPTPLLVASFQSERKLHLVMEYLPHGDLDSFLVSANDGKRNGIGLGRGTISSHPGQLLEEKFLRSFSRDMVAAIGWLHELGIVHR